MASAVGMIECRGLVGALEAGDAMVKAANVTLDGCRALRNGQVTVMVHGDVGAVQAAVDAGVSAVHKVGDLCASHVIPRPHAEAETVIAESFPS